MRHRLYIAGPSEHWDRARCLGAFIADELGDAEVVSRWHATAPEKYPRDAKERAAAVATNVADIDRSTVVIVLCDAGVPRSTFADAGYAIGRGRRVIWVKGKAAEQECIFDAHRLVRVVATGPILSLAGRIARAIENHVAIDQTKEKNDVPMQR